MKNHITRTIALLMAVIMLASSSVLAYADEAAESTENAAIDMTDVSSDQSADTSVIDDISEEIEDVTVDAEDPKAETVDGEEAKDAENSENAEKTEDPEKAEDAEDPENTEDSEIKLAPDGPITGSYAEETLYEGTLDIGDRDELYEEYLEDVFATDYSFQAYNNASKLTGASAAVYAIAKEAMTQLANGQRETSEITVKPTDIGIPEKITAADLGLESLRTEDGSWDGASIIAAIQTLYPYDPLQVIRTLYRDNPYEFYWSENFYHYNNPENADYIFGHHDDETGEDYVYFELDFYICFYVGGDYGKAGTYFDESFSTGVKSVTITIDTEKTSVAVNAKANADKIVAAAADKTDYGKLEYYARQIVSLVDYHPTAMNEDYDGDDTNPWQLVWVFDGDPDTKVVCEGYSKAFQYLCDQTIFDSYEVWIYTVTGYMINVTTETGGGHMWNIAHMEDGKNYLIDVTNCDEGGDDICLDLFMAPYADGDVTNGYIFSLGTTSFKYSYKPETTSLYSTEELTIAEQYYTEGTCTHENTTVKNAIDAICGEPGYSGDTYCTDCEKCIRKGYVTPETGDHDDITDENTIEISPATTTEDGYVRYNCSTCGYIVRCKINKIAGDKIDLDAAKYAYTGSKIEPEVTVYDSTGSDIRAEFYTVSYSNNKKVGQGTITITFKKYYSGTLEANFNIVPATPAAPTLGNTSKGLKISWTADSSVTGYRIYRSVDGGKYSKLTTITDNTTASYVDTDVKNGSTYMYKICAYKKVDGTNYFSFCSDDATRIYITAPASLKASNTTSGTKLTWSAVTGATGYIVYKKTGSGDYAKVTTVTTASYTDTDVKMGVTYAYRVKAYTKPADTSYASAYCTAVTNRYVSQPTISKAANAASGVKVVWGTVSGATGYQVYRCEGTSGSYKKLTTTSEASYVDTTAVSGKTYTYKVRAYQKVNGTNYFSPYSAVKTFVCVARPTISKITSAASGKLYVKWDANTAATGYQMVYATKSDFSDAITVTNTGSAKNTKSIFGLTGGKTYYAKVRSYITIDGVIYYSAYSAVKSIKVTK